MNVDESGEMELKMRRRGGGGGGGGRWREQRTSMNYSTTLMLFMILASGSGGDSEPQNLRTLRLCSRSLSDALYLICQDRGFNEPFSYGHDEAVELTDTPNPGLVQQCCHRPCSYQYLEQYCKPLPSSSSPSPARMVPKSSSRREDVRTYGNEIGEGQSFRIVNLPYSSVREFMQINSESIEYTSTRAPRRKRRRKKVRGMTETSEKCNCHGESVKGKHFQDQRINWQSKIFSGKMKNVPKVGDFQVGTTSPELTDSILVFPFSFKSRPHLKRG